MGRSQIIRSEKRPVLVERLANTTVVAYGNCIGWVHILGITDHCGATVVHRRRTDKAYITRNHICFCQPCSFNNVKQLPNNKLLPFGYAQRMLALIGLLQTLKACFRLSRLASDSFMTADMYSSM